MLGVILGQLCETSIEGSTSARECVLGVFLIQQELCSATWMERCKD